VPTERVVARHKDAATKTNVENAAAYLPEIYQQSGCRVSSDFVKAVENFVERKVDTTIEP
jgi:hypothetical protein